MVYAPVEVEVGQSIKGLLVPGPNRFLIAGGVVGCYTMRVYPSPDVEVGSRYLFILATAYDNTGTKELSSKEAKFAWPVDDDGTVATVDGPMSIDELIEIVNEPRRSLRSRYSHGLALALPEEVVVHWRPRQESGRPVGSMYVSRSWEGTNGQRQRGSQPDRRYGSGQDGASCETWPRFGDLPPTGRSPIDRVGGLSPP